MAPARPDRTAVAPTEHSQTEAPTTSARDREAGAQAALEALAAAVRDRRWSSFRRTASVRDPAFAVTARMIFDNLVEMRPTLLAFRVQPKRAALTGPRQVLLGAGAWLQQASVSWQVPGDVAPAHHLIWVTFIADGPAVAVAGTTDGPLSGLAQPLWWLAPVRSAHTETVSVLVGLGATDVWVRRAQEAALAVRRRLSPAVTPGWSGRLVLEVPRDAATFEQILGVARGSYTAIAAVAWPEGPDPATSAVRVIVNPSLLSRLDGQRLVVLLAHEATHVATRSAASRAPTWLIEGFADYVAYASYPQTTKAAAVPALAAVRRHGAPATLPPDANFSPGAADLDVGYAESWLACRFLADTFSAESLDTFYLTVSSGRASLAEAVTSEFGVSLPEMTQQWRQFLLAMARRAG